MTEIKIFIPGQPQGKERARSRIITKKNTMFEKGRQFVTHYTPTKTRDNESRIRSYAIGVMNGRKAFAGPVSLVLNMAFEIPQSWPKWKQAMALEGKISPTVKPDGDNVEKSIKDGFNSVVWVDDCQVVVCQKRKFYGCTPGVTAVIAELDCAYPAQITRKEIAA